MTQYKTTGSTAAVTFNFDAWGNSADSLVARQLYARHLYILMTAACDAAALDTRLGDSSGEARSRLIAQWAVNCVAFRDHNEIMIPFNYVVCPIVAGKLSLPNSWAPDGLVQHTVWGCKRPSLLISETLAFHDRRTEDRNDEIVDMTKPGRLTNSETAAGYTTDSGVNKDPGFNSRYRPQGSMFVELFNPWPAYEPRTPDLAATSGTVMGVELTKTSGTTSTQSTPSPVWRIIIVDPTRGATNAINTTTGQLPDPDNPAVSSRPYIERVVYFVNLAGGSYYYPPNNTAYPPTIGDAGYVSYFPSVNAYNPAKVVVPQGGYAVIGSGDPKQSNHTFVGFDTSAGTSGGNPATDRMITLNPAEFSATTPNVIRNSADPAVTAPPPAVLGIDQAISYVSSSGSAQRLSISEPTVGYSYYEMSGGTAPVQAVPDANGLYHALSVTGTPVTLDVPVNEKREILAPDPNSSGGEQTAKIWTNYLSQNNTFPAYRIIYLQRLADPTRPYLSETDARGPNFWNPYRTVNAMTVDLTTFNGTAAPNSPIDPTAVGTYHFEAHQRGETNYLTSSGSAFSTEVNLWKQEFWTKGAIPPLWPSGNWSITGSKTTGYAPTAVMYFSQPLSQSLGYLNQPFFGSPAANGDPQFPFPWFNWAYRPFINEYELLQVPCTSSSQLLVNNNGARAGYGYVDQASRAAGLDVYDPVAGGAANNFPHLLNFFESAASTGGAGTSPQFHRVLAYLSVPTPFSHMTTQARPDLAAAAGLHWFHTPFNGISWYREPGRVNLNTLASSNVFMGVVNYHPALAQSGLWSRFWQSRRGDSNAGMTINTSLPSRFGRPFRTPGGAALSPPLVGEPTHEIDATLLRSDPVTPTRPLFQMDDTSMVPPAVTAAPGQTPNNFAYAPTDYNRSSYFRYQGLQRLGSVASCHSNVFAIWITVGYFQVTPTAVGPGNPDGWSLGSELNSDTGDVTRHRGFYIFDRSLPIGFIRGQDVNSKNGFLVQRYIE